MDDSVRGTVDDLIRDEEAVRGPDADLPDYTFFSFTPEGKPVFGHPPIWGKYVLMAPWELYTEDEQEPLESASRAKKQKRSTGFLALSPGYGW